MSDLFRKLNVLVKAGVRDLVGDPGSPRRRALPPERLGKDVDREIALLRERIEDALAYEDKLKAQAGALQDEVSRWDRQADEAVAGENDAAARYAIEQMQRAEQRLSMAKADLRDHQLVTQELIQRVNMLDAAVADARRAEAQQADAAARAGETGQAAPGRLLADVLRETRETIAAMSELVSAKGEAAEASRPAAASEQAVEDDLAQRRQRLSK